MLQDLNEIVWLVVSSGTCTVKEPHKRSFILLGAMAVVSSSELLPDPPQTSWSCPWLCPPDIPQHTCSSPLYPVSFSLHSNPLTSLQLHCPYPSLDSIFPSLDVEAASMVLSQPPPCLDYLQASLCAVPVVFLVCTCITCLPKTCSCS